MLRKLRAHFRQQFVGYLALFVALGGTAVASTIITANSQVAKNTIAGHKPPAGKHANIISGSVGKADLSAGLRTSLKLHCPSGLRRAVDICFEPSLRSGDTYLKALKICGSAQRRLPNDAELTLVFDHSGAPQQLQWVSAHSDNGSAIQGSLLADDASRNIQIGDAAFNLSFPFRCVTSATN